MSNFIKPFLLKYKRKQITSTHNNSAAAAASDNSNSSFLQYWIPLTTHSRAELDRKTPIERYDELIQMLYYLISATKVAPTAASSSSHTSLTNEEDVVIQHLDDDMLVAFIRDNTICRHLASLVMRPYNKASNETKDNTTSMLLFDRPDLRLVQRLAKLWPRLLELPSLRILSSPSSSAGNRNVQNTTVFNISLIIPCYNESYLFIQNQLQLLLENCNSPHIVEVIIVNASGNINGNNCDSILEYLCQKKVDEDDRNVIRRWGSVRVLSFTNGGGRGPCLNYGAYAATGSILTFCHLDTKLPSDWDLKIYTMFHFKKEGKGACELGYATEARANACAFSFGIDTSTKGLSNPFSNDNINYYPPGIKAVETTANIRTKLFSLPYGDQALSIPRDFFVFLGGFPDQCLMEDYELVALLRKRASLITVQPERLKIIPGEPSLCSPRRWQKFGVLFVTFMNSKLVNLYASGVGPDDLYCHYYGRSPPERNHELSPWEIDMNDMIQTMSKSQ